MCRSLRFSAHALVVVLTGVAVAGAVASPVAAEPTAARKATTPSRWDPRLKPIADKVAELRELRFEHPVAAEFLDDTAFEKRVAVDKGKLTKQDKEDIERAQAQLRAVGLIGSGVDIVDAASSLQTSGVLAYYEPATKRITVKGANVDDVDTRVTVAHELTHALQDQHFDLQQLERQAKRDHGSTALRTLIEGDAVRIQDEYVQSLSEADQQAYQRANDQTSEQARADIAAKGVPDALAVAFQAPYALGPSMLAAVIGKEREAGLDALFRDPPVADAAFVTPATLLEHRNFQTVPTPKLAAGEKRSGAPDVFGSLSLFQVLAARLGNDTALGAADAWDGDSMVTFTRAGTTCLRATFAGQGTDGVATIASALDKWVATMPAGAASVKRSGSRSTLTACDPAGAATAITTPPITSLSYLANRDGFFAEVVRSGAPVPVATCSANAFVRDPVITPILDRSANDPTAELDDATIATVRAEVVKIAARCRDAATS